MIDEQTHLLEAILSELRIVTAELQLLRNELKGTPSLRPEEDASSPSYEHESFAAFDAEGASDFAVFDWLRTKGISVRNYREQTGADTVLDQCAVFLGDRFATLWRVHDAIRRCISGEGSFTLNLSSRTQAEIADSTQFCMMLKTYALLSSYKYNKDTKTIYAVPQRVGKIINFFTGGWFERYIYLRVLSRLSQHDVESACLLNPQIILANGDDFELDLLFWVDNWPLWVECKTGDYQIYIAKYSNVRKQLGIPKSRAIMVILGIQDDLAANLTDLYDMTVANEHSFLRAVDAAVRPSGYVPEPILSLLPPAIVAAPPSNLFTLLNRANLRPVPEFRQQVISELIPLVASFEQPMTMIEAKRALAESVPASKSQLQDLLNAIMRAGCLLDDEGLPVLLNTYPFSTLASDDPRVLEKKCIESYARAVLLVDPDYFENASKCAEFERVVGGEAPDMATISRLRAMAPS